MGSHLLVPDEAHPTWGCDPPTPRVRLVVESPRPPRASSNGSSAACNSCARSCTASSFSCSPWACSLRRARRRSASANGCSRSSTAKTVTASTTKPSSTTPPTIHQITSARYRHSRHAAPSLLPRAERLARSRQAPGTRSVRLSSLPPVGLILLVRGESGAGLVPYRLSELDRLQHGHTGA